LEGETARRIQRRSDTIEETESRRSSEATERASAFDHRYYCRKGSTVVSGQSPRSCLDRSELSGFLGQLEKHGSADGDRAFFLESWDGGPYSVDRVKHTEGGKLIRFNSLAIVATVQPDKLVTVFSGPDDGLFTRFLFIMPEPVPPQPPRNHGGNQERIACLRTAFDRLHLLTWAHDYEGREVPELLNIDDEGQDILQRVREEIFEVITKKGVRGIPATWRGKNSGRLLRLALVFQLLEWAYSGGPEPTVVSGEFVRRAELYLQYCQLMFEAVLGELAFTEAQRDAAALARFIHDAKLIRINERKIYQQRGFHHLRNPERRKAAFAELEVAGWIRKANAPAAKGGRPTNDWEVNPLIFKEEA
jgi:hypothetical protein